MRGSAEVPMPSGRARNVLWLMAAIAALALWSAVPAGADVTGLEVSEYSQDAGLPVAEAEEALEVQQAGSESGIVEGLETELGQGYAGVWFDGDSGEFVVPVMAASSQAEVSSEFAQADLSGSDFRTAPAEYSWVELEAAQNELDEALAPLFDAGVVQTSLDPRSNSVVVDVSDAATALQLEAAQGLAADAEVRVDVRRSGSTSLTLSSECHLPILTCNTPLRGGVVLQPAGIDTIPTGAQCTAGFRAYSKTNGSRYMLTAGHCAERATEWVTFTSKEVSHYLGQRAGWVFPVHDYGAIATNGSWWDEEGGPRRAMVAYMGHVTESGGFTAPVDEHRNINAETSSFVGQQVCHTGEQTGTSCGTVTALGVTGEVGGGQTISNLTQFKQICATGGDSGGPVFAGYVAVGIFNATDPQAPGSCQYTGYYTEVTEATAALGVNVARSTDTYLDGGVTKVNGMPGSVTVKGHVYSGNLINGTYAILNYSKLENGSWVYKRSEYPTISNSFFEFANEPVGAGTWRVKAVFPEQAPYTSSESASSEFTIAADSWYKDNLPGGYISRDPDISSWGPGRLDVFGIGADGSTLYHRWYSGGAWSGWEGRTGGYSTGVGAVSWGYNRIDVVGKQLSDGSVAHEYWTNNSWHKDNLGGYIISDPDISSWGDGRLDVFALGADGKTLYHKWFTSTEGWSLGWEARRSGYSSSPSAVSWGYNRIDVVAKDAADGSVLHEWWDGTGWYREDLGGYAGSAPEISSWGPGRLDVFAVGADGKLMYHKWYTTAEGWSDWEPRETGYGSGPGAVSWGYNRIDVVGVRASDHSIQHEFWAP